MVRVVVTLALLYGSSVFAEYQGYSQRPHPFYSPQNNQERQNSYPMSPRLQQQSPPRQKQHQVEPQRQQQYQFEPQRQQQYQFEPQRQQQYQFEPQRQQKYQFEPQRQQQYQFEPQRQQKYQFEPERQQQYQFEPQRQQQNQFEPQRQQQYQLEPQRQQQYQDEPQHQMVQYPQQYRQQNKMPQYPSRYQKQPEMSPYVAQYQLQNQPPHHVDASSQMIDSPESPVSKQVILTTNDMMQSVPAPHLKYDKNEMPVLEFGSTKGFKKNLGDRAARRGEYPYHVQIRENGKFICCGSLIRSPITGKHVIITATHCLVETGTSKLASPKNYEVRVDILNSEDFGQRRKVKQFLVHPGYVVSQYRSRPLYNDIGMMILESDFEENQFVIPIALPTTYGPTIWDLVTITGWGRGREAGNSDLSNVLRVVEMGVWESEDCDRIYFEESGRHVVTDSQFCAGAIEGGLDACQGDSGSPTIALDKGRPYLAGITGWGKGCGLGKYPGLYTRVWSFNKWIKNTLYDYEINGIIPPPPKYPQ